MNIRDRRPRRRFDPMEDCLPRAAAARTETDASAARRAPAPRICAICARAHGVPPPDVAIASVAIPARLRGRTRPPIAPRPPNSARSWCNERKARPAAPRPAAGRTDRLDATPERLARAAEAGQEASAAPTGCAGWSTRSTSCARPARWRRTIPAQRPALADRRGVALACTSAPTSTRCAPCRPSASAPTGFGPRSGLPASEIALHARDKLRAAAELVGPAAWPILTRIVIEGAGVRDCRRLVPDIVTPWRADAVLTDRLRVGLDRLGGVVGVMAREKVTRALDPSRSAFRSPQFSPRL